MNKLLAVPAFVLVMALTAITVAAHHGTGGTYDMEKPVVLKGTITEFKFVNPHVLIYFDVPSANGKKGAVVNWLAAGPSVINWTRAGWNRNSIRAKDEVVVTLFPARDGKAEGVIKKIVTASGKEWCCEGK